MLCKYILHDLDILNFDRLSNTIPGFYTVKAINMNFSEDRDVGILNLFTNFELHRFTNNGNLLSDMNHTKHRQTYTHTHTQRETESTPMPLLLTQKLFISIWLILRYYILIMINLLYEFGIKKSKPVVVQRERHFIKYLNLH